MGGAAFTEIAEEVGLGFNRVHYLHNKVHDRAVETCDFLCREMGLNWYSVATLVFSDALIDMLMSPKLEQLPQLYAALGKARHLSVKQVRECLDEVFLRLWPNRRSEFLRTLAAPWASAVCPPAETLLRAVAEYGKALMRSDTPIELELPVYAGPPFSGGNGRKKNLEVEG